ncbi:hypothetical protein QGX11_gp029 [Pseudomonas phage PPSC2]|uniref:Uncharacterized protein n=1 Tax=Pseudomonas phage PPSC2 TaxID=2041350 RepID=A0A2R2YAY9_9CAUD|nr:hypothetical protein QGX11_gp029 [Pseudomonas phage PPSC2]ATN92792.1 hypothetical protein PPSC2_29 [Pseudomonas phage PPSC2]
MSLKAHFKKHYTAYIMATNAMIGVSTAAFAIMGIFSGSLSTPVLFGNAAVFGMIWAIGRFGNETLEDLEHEGCHHHA